MEIACLRNKYKINIVSANYRALIKKIEITVFRRNAMTMFSNRGFHFLCLGENCTSFHYDLDVKVNFCL